MPGQFHFEVDVPVPIVASDFVLPPVPEWSPSYSHVRVSDTILDPQFRVWLERKRLHPKVWASVLLFYAHTGSRTSVHVDVGHANLWAINYVIGPADVSIQWHAPTDAGQHLDADLNYQRYADDSPVVEHVIADSSKLVVSRIGVPHSSVNNGPGCWLMSLRMTPENLNWSLLKGRFL